MHQEVSLVVGFLIGLFGAVHCVGMCSGIVALLTRRRPSSSSSQPPLLLPYLIYYNLGRILSYAIAGMLTGAIGSQLFNTLPLEHGTAVSQMLTSAFLIAMGLYITGWWRGLVKLEAIGNKFWTILEPYGRKLLPVKAPVQALTVGLIWGWLPCGLV